MNLSGVRVRSGLEPDPAVYLDARADDEAHVLDVGRSDVERLVRIVVAFTVPPHGSNHVRARGHAADLELALIVEACAPLITEPAHKSAAPQHHHCVSSNPISDGIGHTPAHAHDASFLEREI